MAVPPLAFFHGPAPWLVLAAVTVACLWVDLHFFARGRAPTFREGVIWSIGWLVFSLLVVFMLVKREDLGTEATTRTLTAELKRRFADEGAVHRG